MKVVLFNGSPKAKGNTYHALKIVEGELNNTGIETEIVHIGAKTIKACTACGMCRKNKDERCIIDDEVNTWIQQMKEADGMILGSPVHYSAISGGIKSFLDRAFYVSGSNGNLFRHKVGASIVAVRRSGGLEAFNQLNNYLTYAEMIIPTSNYWNVIHGTVPGDIDQDEEGKQIMRVLGKNMSWLMKVIEAGGSSVEKPELEKKAVTNFVR